MCESSQWKHLEPSGLGDELLTDWAPWVREDRASGGATWSTRPRVARAHHGEWPESVRLTDKVVASIRREHPHYYRVIARYYLDELAPWQMVTTLEHTEGWIRTMLLAACGLVEARYRELRSAPASVDLPRPQQT